MLKVKVISGCDRMGRATQLTFDEFEAKQSFREVKGPYELPKGWRWVRIKDVVQEIKSGFACSKSNEVENGIPHLRPHNIGLGRLELSNVVYLPSEFVDLKTYSLKKGDVLFNNTNSKELVGRAALVTENIECGFSNHITRIRVKKDLILPEFLTYSLNYLWITGYFLKVCTKWIGQAGVNNQKLKATRIPLPPLEEQKRIVAKIEELFSKIDRIRELRRQAKEEAENLLKAALHHVFSKADEKGWRWVKLENIAKTTSGGTPTRSVKEYWENGTISWVKSGELEDNVITDTEEKITPLGLKNSNCKLLPKGTLLVAMYGATVGKTAILGIEATTNQAVCAIFPKENIDRDFIRYYIIYVRPKLIERSRNLGGAQPNISQEVIKSLKIPVPFKNNKPDLEEQKRIAAYLDKIAEKQRKLLELYKQTEKELEMMKQAILNKAFRGELS